MEHGSPPPASSARKILPIWQAYNRRRWEFEKDILPSNERAPFLCECTSAECLAAVELTIGEYETAHTSPNWCAVRPGHILPDDGGRVLLRHPHYWGVGMAPLDPA